MADPRYAAHRFLLKDTIRQQIDFSQTGQSRGLPPPPRHGSQARRRSRPRWGARLARSSAA